MGGNAPGRLTPSARYYLLAAGPGVLWGGIAYFLGRRWLGPIIWGGVAASPLIGIVVAAAYRPAYQRPAIVRGMLALVTLYGAATLFGAAVGASDVARGIPDRVAVELVYQAVVGTLWGLTFSGYVLLLWPLAYVNHLLLKPAGADRDV